MKVKFSKLELLDSNLLEVKVNTIPFDDISNEKVIAAFNKYDIDCDFAIPEDTDEIIRVFMKVNINENGSGMGYSIFAEAVCIFRLNEENVPQENKDALRVFSPMYITLNYLRNQIADITTKFHFGRFLLPSIDLNYLIEEKRRLLELKKETND